MANNSAITYRQSNAQSARELGVFNKYCVGDHFPSSYCDVQKRAAEAFEKEACELLTFGSEANNRHMGSVRPLVIKTLLYLGFLPAKQNKSVVAAMIGLLATEPNADIDEFYAAVAKKSDCDVDTVKKYIERAFDTFDAELMEKVTSLTGTTPYTSRDIIYDLALYVRKKYIGRGMYA